MFKSFNQNSFAEINKIKKKTIHRNILCPNEGKRPSRGTKI